MAPEIYKFTPLPFPFPFPFPGYPIPFWIRNIRIIQRVIKEFDIQPIEQELLPRHMVYDSAKMVASEAGSIRDKLMDWPNGGIRGPHLHLADKVYLLDDKQWNAFSTKIVSNIASRIKRSNAVFDLDQIMELDQVSAGM